MKTINGNPISEEQIDTWVAEAEDGYDVKTLRRRGRKPRDEDAAKVISIRFSPSGRIDQDKYAAPSGWVLAHNGVVTLHMCGDVTPLARLNPRLVRIER